MLGILTSGSSQELPTTNDTNDINDDLTWGMIIPYHPRVSHHLGDGYNNIAQTDETLVVGQCTPPAFFYGNDNGNSNGNSWIMNTIVW